MGRAIDGDYSDAPAMLLSPKQDSRGLSGSNFSQNPFAFPSGPAQLPALNLNLSPTPTCALPAFTFATSYAPFAYQQPPPESTTLPRTYPTPTFSNSKKKRSHSDFAAAEEYVSAAPLQQAPVEQGGISWHSDANSCRYDPIRGSPVDRKIQRSTQEDCHRTPYARSPEPQVDSITQTFGISWQRVSTDDKDMAAAIRGWEKYIDNHYARHIHDSKILLKHKGLNAYLVSSASQTLDGNRSFYLFNEDLSEAKLVASDWETCTRLLGCSPIQFPPDSEVIKPEQMQSMEAAGVAAGAEMESGGSGMDLDS